MKKKKQHSYNNHDDNDHPHNNKYLKLIDFFLVHRLFPVKREWFFHQSFNKTEESN